MVTSRIRFTAAQKAELWERWKNGRGQGAARLPLLTQRRHRPDCCNSVAPEVAAPI
jgi:hypothetical protein